MAWIMVPTPKTAKGRVIFGIVMACFGFLLALIMLVAGISNTGEMPIVQRDEFAYADFDSDSAYEFEDVWLVGEYATWIVERDGSDTETCYYMVLFEDKDGEVCYASVEADPTSDFGKKCDEAAENETTMELTGIFTCIEMSSLDDKIEEFYREAYLDCLTEVDGRNIRMNFSYEGEDEAAFLEKRSEQATILFVMAAVFAAGSALAMFLLTRKLKKIKKAEAEYAAAQAAYQAAYNGGYPPYNGGYPNGYPNNGSYPGAYPNNGGYPGGNPGGYPNNGGYPNGGNYPPTQGQ